MAPSTSGEDLLVQIPPHTSPVLRPHHHRSHHPNHRNPDLPGEDELEFLAPGQWDNQAGHFTEDDDGSDEDGDLVDEDDEVVPDDDIEDWSLEDGHIAGVPCANVKLDAKHCHTPEFLNTLLQLLCHELSIPGWDTLPYDTPSSLVHVHRVSGSLTNAVFFVSIPDTEVELETAVPFGSPEDLSEPDRSLSLAEQIRSDGGAGTPVVGQSTRASPATIFSELERGRQAAATPTPGTSSDSAPSTPLSVPRPLPLPGAMPEEEDDEDDETDDEGPQGIPSRRDSSATTSPRLEPFRTRTRTEKVTISAPTLLLRIYGPQSGSLISRRNELHILHTLSSQYGIGAHVLGTFANGRVEEYFHSRALAKEEMRDERISRWIGRRMRELHSVELDQMQPPPRGEEELEEMRRRSRSQSLDSIASDSSGNGDKRPGIDPVVSSSSPNRSPHSGASIYSTSSSSSVFSFGTSSSSSYSGYSTGSSIRSGSGGSYTGSLVSSPGLLPTRTPSESDAQAKKRPRRRGGSSRSGSGSSSGRRRTKQWTSGTKDKLCVWENITRWTREAKLVLKELDELAQLPGFATLLAARSAASTPGGPAQPLTREQEKAAEGKHVTPLSHPSLTVYLRSVLNLPLFEHQLRMYRSYVRRVERGTPTPATTSTPSAPHPYTSIPPTHPLRSKRVFAHNDTQYGNLLLVTPKTDDPAEEEEIERQARREGGAHRRLIVVDFEYAGANPRGFDIANHFCEWQADYHHPSLPHSLSHHGRYPSHAEKTRFLRAYVGCDGGIDERSSSSSAITSTTSTGGSNGGKEEKEDPRVERLLDEVKLWQPSSHALWAVWGIVQAKEDLMARIEVWKERAAKVAASPLPIPSGAAGLVESIRSMNLSEEDVMGLQDLSELDEVGEVFDYLSYAAERMGMFRRELDELGVML
ncbi:hypothetical protein JCM11251_005154 [Rhodosporidiobolus azoricus]